MNRFIILARPPAKGKVKKRIARTAGDRAALEVYTILLKRALELLEGLPAIYSPTIAWSDFSYDNPKVNCAVTYQPSGNFTESVRYLMNESLREGMDKVILAGVDCPSLTVEDINHAFDQLDDNVAVLGPSSTNRPYLIGATRPLTSIFPEIEGEIHLQLNDMVESLQKAKLPFSLLDDKLTICQWTDWQKWQSSFL
ncbi:DUF2064 domain-containing protein [bacterium]|nr:DUF2064 domain-containing protein [bacterium]